MWRYPEPSKIKIFSIFAIFVKNPEKSKFSQDLAVALCGATLNLQKVRIFQFFRFLGKSRKVKNFSRLAVALCGAMWRYPEPSKIKIFSIFAIFGKNPEKSKISQDLAVALCGAILNPQKWRIFHVFRFLGKIPKSQEFLKIWLWHYVALCGAFLNPQKLRNGHVFRFFGEVSISQEFLKIWLWHSWWYREPSTIYISILRSLKKFSRFRDLFKIGLRRNAVLSCILESSDLYFWIVYSLNSWEHLEKLGFSRSLARARSSSKSISVLLFFCKTGILKRCLLKFVAVALWTVISYFALFSTCLSKNTCGFPQVKIIFDFLIETLDVWHVQKMFVAVSENSV